MELKVWVDGVQRVVCGLSEETSCHDVVIALAQAIGQTGRYVLVQKLRDTERQLVANERPLESLAKLGQLSSEVQFILRRTGPTSSEGSDLDRAPALPKFQEPEPPKRNAQKSLTFNLGPTTSAQPRIKQLKKVPRDSPGLRAPSGPSSSHAQTGPSKEEIFRQVLQQQGKLQALQAQLENLEQQVWTLEQPPPPTLSPELLEEMDLLGEAFRRNEAELAHGEYWESEYLSEVQREQSMLKQLRNINAALDEQSQRIHETENQSGSLQRDIQLQAENRKNGMRHARAGIEESLGQVRGQLDTALRQGSDLGSSVDETEKALKMAEELLQAKSEELDELNKELRQCNLQQFIQQTGPPVQSSVQPDDDIAHLMPDGQSDEDSNLSVLEFNPRTTAKQILGNPRSLQNPLVSSLHPEVLSSREVSWR
ncbi:LOW QUALITY PROTEIN: ras association domain-containing protein 7b [Colossoma macropomum]|uniref:LOW QUALITY PROTEIN: ras association domain-containing protein 7b n=1 Tax=Colossoma macropomum TaxID=42526 RepID=UPI0018647495|nr:LOW QUALITY PROTEIN: ras association domain-containing protein 7b [Colossoma macropomum]